MADNFWGKGCYHHSDPTYSDLSIAGKLGYFPALNILDAGDSKYGFVFDLIYPYTISSIFIYTGEMFRLYSSYGNQEIIGTVRIGDSTSYANNSECTTVRGQGFYNCSTELHGQYISFHATDAVYSTYGLFVLNFKAYASENLSMLSGTTFEVVDPSGHGTYHLFNQPFETNMHKMNPRYSAMGGITPYEGDCGVYDGVYPGQIYFKVPLPQAYYIEYILVTGEAYDDPATTNVNLANPIHTEGTDCSNFDNAYWNGVQAYATNTSTNDGSWTDANNLCGTVGAAPLSTNDSPDTNGMLEIVKMGGTVECPTVGK